VSEALGDLKINNALKYDLNTVRSELTEIAKLVNNLSFGDIISDEDF
jgi:hypothetical protein